MKRISKSEKRSIRRAIINNFLHLGFKKLSLLKSRTRAAEIFYWGKEMKIFK